jgi:hypothetical protein
MAMGHPQEEEEEEEEEEALLVTCATPFATAPRQGPDQLGRVML